MIKDLSKNVGEKVKINGWVYNFRSSGKISFWQLRDGSGFVQVIIEKSSVPDEIWKESSKITLESAVEVEGIVSQHPKKDDVVEIQATSVKLIHIAEEYPISNKEHGPDFLLENRHLWIRSPGQESILRIRSEVVFAIQEFLRSEDFVLTHTPTFTPNACEGTTDLFEVKYFDEKIFLTQNGSLYLEALASALGRVYDINPNFRAEKSKTRKHLTEFWSCNPEAAFMEHAESLELQERMIVFVVKVILDRCKKELEILERDINLLLPTTNERFPRLTYAEAVTELQSRGSSIVYGDDLGAEDEILLLEGRETPLFVVNWPKKIKAFYMKVHPDDSSLFLNADIIAPEGYGELVGGSERESDYNKLHEQIVTHKLPLDEFKWYLDLRRYGSVPHSGFGIGIERFVAWITGAKHVRETTAFPRTIYRVRP
jgi:asparaginyl-tRNA synthetase